MIIESRALPSFWDLYHSFPKDIQERADKQFALLTQNPSHPSLHLKPVGEFWSVRVTDSHRAVAFREGNVLTWFWIGLHDDYARLLKRG